MEIGFLLGYSGFLIVMLEMLFVHLAEKRLTIAQTLFLGTVLCGASFAIIGFSFEVLVVTLVWETFSVELVLFDIGKISLRFL